MTYHHGSQDSLIGIVLRLCAGHGWKTLQVRLVNEGGVPQAGRISPAMAVCQGNPGGVRVNKLSEVDAEEEAGEPTLDRMFNGRVC